MEGGFDMRQDDCRREVRSILYQIPQHPTVDRDNIYQKFGFPVMDKDLNLY